MKWLGVAGSLGSPWAYTFRAWLTMFVPTAIVVALQETETTFSNFGLVLLSAIVQHVVAGLATRPLVAIIRRKRQTLPLWASFTTWTISGLARAVSGVAVILWFTDDDVDLLFRVISWLLVVWTWMPLLTYAGAQVRQRKPLLVERTRALRRRNEARERRAQTAEQIRSQLVSDVSVATTMVITEIESALDASKHQLNAHRLELVGDRVADVSAQVRMAVGRLSEEPTVGSPDAAPVAASMEAAFRFQRERSWMWSILGAVALAAVIMPIAYHSGGLPLLAELTISLAVIAAILGITSRYGSPTAATSVSKTAAWSVLRHATAGLAGASVLLVLSWSELGNFTTVLLVVLPYTAAVAAETLSATVGVAEANRKILSSIADLELERQNLDATAVENENRIRQDLYEVMHGPILGRLSSCAMALNFLASEAETVPSDRITTLTTAVLDHLSQTMHDLSLLKS